MYYKFNLSDRRINVASPENIVSYDDVIHGVVELQDVTAYMDPVNIYRVTETFDGIEIDPTYTPPPFDLGTAELKALLKLIVDQFNVLRSNAGLPEITYQQAKDVIKGELGL